MNQQYAKETYENSLAVKQKSSLFSRMVDGIGFTFFIALLGLGLFQVNGFERVGPLACAITIAIVCRQIWDYPEKNPCGY